VTPGNEGSERDTMTATRLGPVGTPGTAGPQVDRPVVVARSSWPARVVRFGTPVAAVASALVGLVLFGDTDPSLWGYSYWPVRELLSAAVAFSIGGAALLGYRKARWPAFAMVICGLLAGFSVLFAGLWLQAALAFGGLSEVAHLLIMANGVATDLLIGLSLTSSFPTGHFRGGSGGSCSACRPDWSRLRR
jgi:hypothetical protein